MAYTRCISDACNLCMSAIAFWIAPNVQVHVFILLFSMWDWYLRAGSEENGFDTTSFKHRRFTIRDVHATMKVKDESWRTLFLVGELEFYRKSYIFSLKARILSHSVIASICNLDAFCLTQYNVSFTVLILINVFNLKSCTLPHAHYTMQL